MVGLGSGSPEFECLVWFGVFHYEKRQFRREEGKVSTRVKKERNEWMNE